MDDITDLYLYINLEEKLEVICWLLIHSVFKGRNETVLNFNYDPSLCTEIGQIIYPK